mgnify:CR=1 FL=1
MFARGAWRQREIARADIESAPTVRMKGCDNRKVARGAAMRRRPVKCACIAGGYRIRPYGNMILAPEGSIGRGRKGVKKNAALLHFLAFAFSDHIIGVPRGGQPLGRGPLPRNSGTFFVSFFGHKKGKPSGGSPLPKVSRRKVAANALAQKNIAIPPRIVYDIG